MRIPAEVKDGDSVRQKLNEIIRYLRDNRPAAPIPRKIVRKTSGGANPPFHVVLLSETTEGSTSYKVKVMPGWVIETIPGPDDALQYHEPANLWDETDATQLAEFAITADQAVYVSVSVKEDGTIGAAGEEDAVSIVIDANDAESTHYQPKVDDESSDGAAGTMKYKLAVLEAGEGGSPPTFKKYASGSHIHHYQELPQMRCDGDGVPVIKSWADSEKAYKLRSIKGRYGVNEEDGGDQINLDFDAENIGQAEDEESPDCEVYKDPAGEEGFSGHAEGKAQFRILRGLTVAERTAEEMDAVQVQVSQVGESIRIRGNGNKGSLTFTNCNGDIQYSLEWEDGLITNAGDDLLTLGDCGSSGGGE